MQSVNEYPYKQKGYHMTIQLFVGANNQTKRVEMDKLEATLSKRHKGFTIQRGVGSWEGEKEQNAIVTIDDDKEDILATVKDLKYALKQDSIAYMEVNQLQFA
jgi:hypothetical protein